MELFYRTYGEGRPLIILHGLYGLSDNWVSIAKQLAKEFKVYLPDQRNHGKSPHSDIFNYYALSDDLYEFIEDHKLDNPILMGHSMGGKVAIHFVMENPEMIDKLVVVDISVRTYPYRKTHQEIIDAMMGINFDELKSRAEIEAFLEPRIKNFSTRQFILKNLDRKDKNTLGWKLNINAIYDNLDSIFQGLLSNETFEKPTLFIRGGLSDYITDEDIPLIRKNFPTAKIETIASATHWVHADAPEELCKTLNDFLGSEC